MVGAAGNSVLVLEILLDGVAVLRSDGDCSDFCFAVVGSGGSGESNHLAYGVDRSVFDDLLI
jgi:hypothetical protein